jgi:hypothetical protein
MMTLPTRSENRMSALVIDNARPSEHHCFAIEGRLRLEQINK